MRGGGGGDRATSGSTAGDAEWRVGLQPAVNIVSDVNGGLGTARPAGRRPPHRYA